MKKFFKHAVYFFVAAAMAAPIASCEEDDENELSEKWDLSDVTVTANADGTLTFDGTIKSDRKVTEFVLLDENGEEAYNLVSEKSAKSEEGADKKWTTNISAQVKVGVYTLKADARFTKTQTISIGEKFSATLGNSASSLGSYYNVTTNTVYTSADVKGGALGDGAIQVIDQDNEIAYGTNAKIFNTTDDEAVKAQFSTVFIGESDGQKYIVTEDGTIAAITNTSLEGNDLTIEGVKITSAASKTGGFQIDITAVQDQMKSLAVAE